MYWKLRNTMPQDEAYIESVSKKMEKFGISFNKGISLKEMKIPVFEETLSKDGGKMADLLIHDFAGLLFSPKLRKLFEDLGVTNIEYFDCKVKDVKKNKVHENYKIANIVGLVECIDMKKSEMKLADPEDPDSKILSARNIVLKKKIPSNLKIFRTKYLTRLILIHDDVKNAIEERGITGCSIAASDDALVK